MASRLAHFSLFKRTYLISSLKFLYNLLVSLIGIKHLLLAGVKQDLYHAK